MGHPATAGWCLAGWGRRRPRGHPGDPDKEEPGQSAADASSGSVDISRHSGESRNPVAEILSDPSRFFVSQSLDSRFRENDGGGAGMTVKCQRALGSGQL